MTSAVSIMGGLLLPIGTGVEATIEDSQTVELPKNSVAVFVQGVKRWVDGTSSYLQKHIATPLEDELLFLNQTTIGDQVNSYRQQTSLTEAPTRRLQTYLRNLVHSGELSSETASLAWRTWNQLRKATSYALPVPDACPGPDNQLLYTWDNTEHHFEVEIFPEGTGEFFYRNRVSGQLWEAEYTVGQPVPQEIIDKLELFL